MAVQHVNTFLYMGLAADPKPTNPADNAKYLETDTGAVWIAVNATWTKITGATVSISI